MSERRGISRRTVLRGVGCALALPLLEAMTARPARGLAATGNGSQARPRMAFIFTPNGAHMPLWTPEKEGSEFDLPYILQPLTEVKDDLLVLSGLTHDKGRANGDGPGDHARSASVFLTGAQPRKTSGANIRAGISVDQVAAQTLGHLTAFPSLELGCEPGRQAGNCDSGYSCAYSSNISWASETTPVGKEVNPRLVFERLFADASPSKQSGDRAGRNLLQRSILDFVKEDAQQLHARLGGADRRKLDEYLTAVREIERRIQRSGQAGAAALSSPLLAIPEDPTSDYEQHIRLMCDLIALAFQTDLTRIVTFMFANAGSNRSYRMVGVPEGHHNLSHHGNDPVKLEKISQINRFHVTQFAYLLRKLKSIPEGDGSLLDHCMIFYGSGISDGNRHNNENLPLLLAGSGGGAIRPGRHVRYERETPVTNLFLSLLDRFGVQVDRLGDSTGRLPYLDA